MRLLIKYPTRSRPKEFLFALDKYVSLLSGKHEVRMIVSADADDKSMNSEEVREGVCDLIDKYHAYIHIFYGNSKSKIEACNADIEKAGEWDVVLLASDDMIPQVHGYDDIILTELLTRFPDTDGALFFNDGTDTFRRNLCTITVFGRKYFDRFGYLYHPEYKSFWCDNEQTEVGQMLGKMPAIDRVIIQNTHPCWGGSFVNDDLYKKNNPFFKPDKRVYERRKRTNFGLSMEAPNPMPDEPHAGPLLSILIPTIPERKEDFSFLLSELQKQSEPFGDQVEIIWNDAPKLSMSIGAKRNRLYQDAKGKYSVQIDDDDGVPNDYVEKVMQSLESNPDFVGYHELCIMDGEVKYSCHSNQFKDWGNNIGGFDYARTPFFKDVIRTAICRNIPVKDIRFGEDHEWSRDLKASGLIKNEILIQEVMYFYSHDTLSKQGHKQRYGI